MPPRLPRSHTLGGILDLDPRPIGQSRTRFSAICDMRRGMPDLAVAAITKALSLDPHNWNYEYGLALMRAAAGLDPRAAARKAISMNPLEPLPQQASQAFRSDTPQEWEADGKAISVQFTSL